MLAILACSKTSHRSVIRWIWLQFIDSIEVNTDIEKKHSATN